MGSLAGRSWLDHKNQTLSAVVFLDRPSAVDWPTRCAGQNVSDEHAVYPSGDCALPDILRYKVYYNDTTRYSRASRTYTPFYPLDATREVQRAVDEAVITLRGRRAGLQNCNDTIIAVNSSDAGNESYWVPVPAGMGLTRARLQCGAGKNCAYDNRELEGHPPPNGSISTAHLDPSSEGPGEHTHASLPHFRDLLIRGGCGVDLPDDWALVPAPYHLDDPEAGFRIIRYDSPANPGWGWQHLELVTTFCRPDWRADVTVNMKSMPVVGDAKVEEMLAESVFLGFGVLFFYCGQLSR